MEIPEQITVRLKMPSTKDTADALRRVTAWMQEHEAQNGELPDAVAVAAKVHEEYAKLPFLLDGRPTHMHLTDKAAQEIARELREDR